MISWHRRGAIDSKFTACGPSRLRELGVELERDVALQRYRHRAGRFYLLRDLGELILFEARNRRAHGELHRRDLESLTDFFDRAPSLRLDVGRRLTGALQGAAQGHAEARGLGGGEKLLRVRPRRFFESRSE